MHVRSMFFVACCFVATLACADHLWSIQQIVPDDVAEAARSQAVLYSVAAVDPQRIQARLAGISDGASDASQPFEIPMPDGSTQRFALFEVPVMEPELAARFPQVEAYAGTSLDVPGAMARVTFPARGFHALCRGVRRAAVSVIAFTGAQQAVDNTLALYSQRLKE